MCGSPLTRDGPAGTRLAQGHATDPRVPPPRSSAPSARIARQDELERSPLAVHVGRDGANRAAMALDRQATEDQAEAPAAQALQGPRLALPVLAEQRRQLVGGDDAPAVPDAHQQAAV